MLRGARAMMQNDASRRTAQSRDQRRLVGVIQVEHLREARPPQAAEEAGPLRPPPRQRERGVHVAVHREQISETGFHEDVELRIRPVQP